MRILAHACFLLTLLASPGLASNHVSVASKAMALADTLSEKLNTIGNFDVTYSMISTNTMTNALSFLVNPQRKYCLMKMATRTNTSAHIYAVIDLAGIAMDDASFDVLSVDPMSHAQRLHFPLGKMLKQPDNPIGLISFISKQWLSNSTSEGVLQVPVVMSWDLCLTATTLHASVGWSHKDYALDVAWLKHSVVSNALSFVESSGSVDFSYADGHVVSVDKATGLLLRDSYPSPSRTGSREIVMSQVVTNISDKPYSDFIPGFDTLVINEIPATNLYESMYAAYLDGLGSRLATLTNLDERLSQLSAEYTNNTRALAHAAYIQRARDHLGKKEPMIAKVVPLLRKAYTRGLEEFPKSMNDVNFAAFVHLAVTRPDSPFRPDSDRNELQEGLIECETSIAHLPETSRTALRKVLERGIPAMKQGFIDAYSEALADAIIAWDTEHPPHAP